MKILTLLLLSFSTSLWAQSSTPTGILLDSPWKSSLYKFAQDNIKHPSWGITHSERNYQLTKKLAEKEEIIIDEDVLFAAAFLHDLGGLATYEKPGVDHAVRSAEIAGPILEKMNFPMEKLTQVQEIILGHGYYNPATGSDVSKLFRDADILDFLGSIGAARIFAITFEGNPEKPSLDGSMSILKKFSTTMAEKCHFHSSKALGKKRELELKKILQSIDEASFGGKAY